MESVTIDDLARASQPPQFALMDRLAQLFAEGACVTSLLVRGSLATGRADRLSDVDFVIGVRDADFVPFVRALDAFMAVEAGAILPGWRDTIVRRMGGLGYVYLTASGGRLHQVDIYAVPGSLIPAVQEKTDARLLYGDASARAGPEGVNKTVAAFVDSELERPQGCSDNFIETLILIQMIHKRIRRGQYFAAYGETYLLMNAVKNYIKAVLVPTSSHWGWYHLEEDLGSTATGTACLSDLADLISSPPVRSVERLEHMFQRIEGIIRRSGAEDLASLAPALAAYKHYLGFA